MDVFAEYGVVGTTISEVERRVGLAVGTGSLYRHFPSKTALFRAAVECEVTRLRAELEEGQTALRKVADPAERRLRFYRRRLRGLRKFDRLFRLMLNEGDRVPEVREAIWAVLEDPARNNQRVDDPLYAVAEAALGGYHLFSMMQGHPYRGVGEDRFLRTLVEITEPARRRRTGSTG